MFKRASTAAFTLSVTFAAAHLGSHPAVVPVAPAMAGIHASSDSPASEKLPYVGGCSAYNATTEGRPHTDPEDENEGSATSLIDGFFGLSAATNPPLPADVRYAIAFAPDPRHTNLSMIFDREMALFVQAAQDSGYDYNSSWLPWRRESETALDRLGERQTADDLTGERENCPGVILFRHRQEPGTESFTKGLLVFVVGEQATGGINQGQWKNAINWIAVHSAPQGPAAVAAADQKLAGDGVLRILGPTFTGSLPSLNRDLKDLYGSPSSDQKRGKPTDDQRRASTVRERFPSVRILSGSVSSCSAVKSFQRDLPRSPETEPSGNPPWHIDFGTFQENDSLHIYRFLNYLSLEGTRPSDTAILSEDETAYAAGDASDTDCDFPYAQDNRPIQLVFPRDISALRNAYEKQAVFDTSNAGLKERAHPILSDDVPAENSQAQVTDTIASSSGSVAAVDQEANLYGLVSILRTHHARYLILRCTNPLDYLFLTRFFHRAYPQARIVTLGSDLLFRREIDTTEFRGVLSLSSYPLLSRSQHWTDITEDRWDEHRHNHLVFQGNLAEGMYIAARYTLYEKNLKNPDPEVQQLSDIPLIPAQKDNIHDLQHKTPLNIYRAFPLADYADPFWSNPDPQKPVNPDMHPPTWISALGRDGYWPIAAIKDHKLTQICLENEDNICAHASGVSRRPEPASTMVRVWQPQPSAFKPPAGQQHYEFKRAKSEAARRVYNPQLLINVPMAWTVTALLALSLVCYQVWGLWRGGLNPSDGLFSVFRLSPDLSHGALMGVSCALALMLLFELAGVFLIPLEFLKVSNSVDGITILLAIVVISAFTFPRLLAWRKSELIRRLLKPLPHFETLGVATFIGSSVLFTALYWITYRLHRYEENDVPLFYRMLHLTSGVSPLLPILLLTFGFYLWNWQAMAGSLIVSRGCPLLPEIQSPKQPKHGWLRTRIHALLSYSVPPQDLKSTARLKESSTRISQELGRKILRLAHPLNFAWRIIAAPIGLLIATVICFAIPHNLPLLGLEGNWFNRVVNGILMAALIFTATEALRLYSTWVELRKLLLALGRLRLRRTIARLRPIDSKSIWSVSGSVRRVQYDLFHHQLGAANRLLLLTAASPLGNQPFEHLQTAKDYGEEFCRRIESHFRAVVGWNSPLAPAAMTCLNLREVMADAAGEVCNALIEVWDTETKSLDIDAAAKTSESTPEQLPLSDDPRVCAAEEFVAYHYIAFIQNIIARMRTMTLSMIFLFITVCLAISFYPFVPRTEVGVWLMLNLSLIGLAVAYVYAGMERDEILSYIANTPPGRLGGDFYVRLAGFLAGPAIGVLTTQFPAITDTAVQWLQPGLDAIK